MAKPQSSRKPRPGGKLVDGGSFHDYNPLRTNPNREQFEPTESQPIRQRARMGGDPTDENAELTPGQAMAQKMRLQNTKPADKTDRELMESKGANDPKSDVGKERIRRINSEVR